MTSKDFPRKHLSELTFYEIRSLIAFGEHEQREWHRFLDALRTELVRRMVK